MWQKVREYTHPEGKTQYFYTTDVIPDYDTGLDKMLAIINKTSTGPGSYSLKLVGFHGRGRLGYRAPWPI